MVEVKRVGLRRWCCQLARKCTRDGGDGSDYGPSVF